MCSLCVFQCAFLTGVAVVQPDAMAVVFTVTLHGVVGEVALGHLEVRIYNDLIRGDDQRHTERTERRGYDEIIYTVK